MEFSQKIYDYLSVCVTIALCLVLLFCVLGNGNSNQIMILLYALIGWAVVSQVLRKWINR